VLFLIISLLLIIPYAVFCIYCVLGIARLRSIPFPLHLPVKKLFTVIIPFKNESENLKNLLACLNQQLLDQHFYSIVFVNDHSTDNSSILVKEYVNNNSIANIYHLPDGENGKKAALHLAIRNINTPYILNIDADVFFHPSFLKHVAESLVYKPLLVQNAVHMQILPGLFNQLQALEFMSLTAVTAGTAAYGKPVLASAASLLYEAELWNKIPKDNLYFHPSGDDMMLLQAAFKFSNNRLITYNPSAEVFIQPSKTFRAFLQQRIRWASKSIYYKNIYIATTALLVLAVNGWILLLAALALLGVISPIYLIMYFLAKLGNDFFLLLSASRKFSRMSLMAYYPITAVLYPFYAVLIPLFSVFSSVKWKH